MASQNELSEIPGDYILGHYITTTRTSFIIPHQKGGFQSTCKALTQWFASLVTLENTIWEICYFRSSTVLINMVIHRYATLSTKQ